MVGLVSLVPPYGLRFYQEITHVAELIVSLDHP